MDAVGDMKSSVIIGVELTCANHDREDFIHRWVDDIQTSGFDTSLYPLLEISMECGEHAIYHTVDDIPLVDVPCPCGNPNHWLVKWTDL